MSRESEFASARMRHSVWCECYDEVMSIPAKGERSKLLWKTAGLVRADRNERRMDAFLQTCFAERMEANHA